MVEKFSFEAYITFKNSCEVVQTLGVCPKWHFEMCSCVIFCVDVGLLFLSLLYCIFTFYYCYFKYCHFNVYTKMTVSDSHTVQYTLYDYRC